jgi:hypothetical protein
MSQTIELRRGLAIGWSGANPILNPGEAGVELDTGQMKVGDGSTPWNNRPYVGTGSGGSSGSPNLDGGTASSNYGGITAIDGGSS